MTTVRVNDSGLILPLSVPQRGSGFTSANVDQVIVGGVTSTDAFQKVQLPATGSLLISQGASALPVGNTALDLLGCVS